MKIKPFAKVSSTQLKKYVLRAPFPNTELTRIKSYMRRLGIKPNCPLILTPTTGLDLNSASAILPGPSLPHAVLAKGTTARAWGQQLGMRHTKKLQTSQLQKRQLQRGKEAVTKKNFLGMWDLTQAQHSHHLSRWSYIAQKSWLMSRGMTSTTTDLPHLPHQSLFLLKWKWKPRSHNQTKMSSCELAKFRVLPFVWMGIYKNLARFRRFGTSPT